jgi:hypothetical protein
MLHTAGDVRRSVATEIFSIRTCIRLTKIYEMNLNNMTMALGLEKTVLLEYNVQLLKFIALSLPALALLFQAVINKSDDSIYRLTRISRESTKDPVKMIYYTSLFLLVMGYLPHLGHTGRCRQIFQQVY